MQGKKRRTILIVIAIIYCILNVLWYMSGYFRDNHPQVLIPTYIDILFYFLEVSIPVSTFVAVTWIREKKIIRAIAVINACVLVVFLTASGTLVYDTHSKYSHDYIESEYINGISLTSVEECLADSNNYILYIGRNDCEECKSAEKIIGQALKKTDLIIQGYYTNLDRDGKTSEHMYEVLDSIGVNGVPAVVYKSHTGDVSLVEINENEILRYVDELE